MDVPISIYTSVVKLTGANVPPISLPPSLEETQPAINPPGTSDISGLVPYNGAIDNVDLGEQGLSTGFVKYDNTPTGTPTDSGTVVWNPDKYTLDLSMGLGGSVQQIGMETYYTPVKNQTGSLIPDGTFVMATGSLGASGRITVAPAVTDGSVDSRYMLGVTTHDIANGGDGLVTWFGEIRGFNTNTKAPIGETWVDGTVLWNNPAVAGGFTSVEPQAPNLKIPVAIVISAGNNGVIFVRPRLGMRLTDLHDVDAFTPNDKDLISYDSALGHWNAKSLGSVIGGTSSQFLKGDGSLDSNAYALASQINIASGQVAFGTGTNTIGGDSGLTWDNTNKFLRLNAGTAASTGVDLQIQRETTGQVSLRITNSTAINGTSRLILNSSSDTNSNGFQIINNANNGIVNLLNYKNSDLAIWTNTIERMRITSTGLLGIATTSPTNTLDVNGTTRIRTISNATGNFLTTSATGVIQQRTASETRTDIGAIGGTIASGQVAFGTGSGTIGGSNNFKFENAQIFGLVGSGNLGLRLTNLSITGNKLVKIGIPHYDIGEEDIIGIYMQSFVSSNVLIYGGGASAQNSITNHRWRVGSTNITTDGTTRMNLSNSGLSLFNGDTVASNTLDVNGTARIRTLSNATGDFVTASATGVLQKRTASETRTDIGAIGGSGITNYLSKFTASGTIGNSAVFESGGNVGIGTTSPNILGFGRVVSIQDSGSPAFAMIIGTTSTADIVATTAGTFISTRTSTPLILQTNNLERLRITSSGNLLIGTTTDSGQRLQVSGESQFSSPTSANNAYNKVAFFSIAGGSQGGEIGSRTISADATQGLYIHSVNSTTISGGQSLRFHVGALPATATDVSTERMRITSSGNVGIGTTSPTFYSGYTVLTLGGSAIGLLKLRSAYNSGNGFELYQNTSGDVFFNINSNDNALLITSSGNVGIGTTTPTNTIDVNGTARIRTLTGTIGYLPLLSSTGVMGQSVLYNTSAGSVLIGTINEVSGHKVRISGGALNITNWQSSEGAYDKLSIDFGEFRGIGYDSGYNEVFFAGTVTVPVKIDTDAPTDSLVINASGNVSVGGQLHSPVVAKGNSSTAVTFDWNDGNIQTVTLTDNCTFTFSNPQSGASYQIIITQDATGGRTITWPTGIYWEGKTIPSLTGTASSRDIVTITYDGTNYNALIARNFGT